MEREAEIGPQHLRFAKDSGTKNEIFFIRMMSATAMQIQENMHVCFIDYAKALDKLPHKNLCELRE